MSQILEAIYENGVLRPLEKLDLEEQQRVRVELHDDSFGDVKEHLKAWHELYEGFTDEEVAEIDSIVLDRASFMKRAVDV